MNILVQKSWRLTAILIAMFMFVTTGASALGLNKNPGVFPLNAHIHGLTYNQWSARWWQWVLSLHNFDDCTVNQSGKLWFLAGTTGGPSVTRQCSIPAGNAIMFPIINAEWSKLEAKANQNKCIVP